MSVTGLSSLLLWAIAGVFVVGAVTVAVAHQSAARIAVGAVAVLIGLVLFAAHQQVSSLPADSPGALCTGGVNWFGITVTGSDALCTDYR